MEMYRYPGNNDASINDESDEPEDRRIPTKIIDEKVNIN